MNFKELHEGAEPKMPGAPSGISIMTPQQFVAKSAAGEEPQPEEGVAEATGDKPFDQMMTTIKRGTNKQKTADRKEQQKQTQQQARNAFGNMFGGGNPADKLKIREQGVAEASSDFGTSRKELARQKAESEQKKQAQKSKEERADMNLKNYQSGNVRANYKEGVAEGQEHLDRIRSLSGLGQINESEVKTAYHKAYLKHGGGGRVPNKAASDQAYAEIGKTYGPKALSQLQKLHGTYTDAAHKAGSVYKDVDEATKLPAQTRDLDSQEFQDYMKRIVGTPDLDKAGNVKVDKKGNEKYTTGKTAGDKYKMPYIHRSSVVSYLSPDGKSYDEDAVKKTLAIRPKALLKQNEKMKHSNGEFEQFFNVGFAALVGIALDEQTNNLIVVNTCPGAGSCKVDCFAMKGGKIQFKAAWQSDGRILTYLLNDPDGFFNQLSNEISVESQAAAKGDKKFPNGWQTTVRWHDAGDFFSPEYLDLALKMAAKHPDVRFYAYTKMAGAALAKKPPNFIINWSEGANTTQEKQVKANDPNLDKTKNSRIVPEKLFYDLLAKDEKGNLKKTDDGAWQPEGPEALQQMKQRIAKEYGIRVSSILSYTEYMAKRNSIPAGMKYNVIVAPGEGDVSANDPGVLSTLLLRH